MLDENIYCCIIDSEQIPTNGPLIFTGDHEDRHQIKSHKAPAEKQHEKS